MWKHLYDKLGGNSSNTSAATCTRKHYERFVKQNEKIMYSSLDELTFHFITKF